MKFKTQQKLLILVAILTGFSVVGFYNSSHRAANLSSVSDTLSNPRPSFRGALTTGNTAGGSQVIINTTANAYPSTSSAQLVEGDVVLIGEAGSLGSYTVASTSSLSTFNITAVLAAGDADSGDDIISTSSASHTVRFTTANALPNGRFRILVPSLSNDAASSDGVPDGGYFDFSTSAPTVTCPTDITGYDFVTGTATASTITINGTDYHAFECAYSGNGAVGTAFNGSTNDAITISSLINPAPATSHTSGTADAHNIIVQHINSSFVVTDQTTIQVGVIEAVKVTATVPPQITFKVLGLAAGTSACGNTTGVTTTATTVPFGEVSISAFTDAAQALTVSTNAAGGFSVTAKENDQMGKDGTACAGADGSGLDNCIPDAEVTSMTSTSTQTWTSTSFKGFAYALHDVNSTTTEAFAYNSPGAFSARHFADTAASETAVTIFSNTGASDNHNVYVCYRLIPETTTQAGYYENYVTYTATATF